MRFRGVSRRIRRLEESNTLYVGLLILAWAMTAVTIIAVYVDIITR